MNKDNLMQTAIFGTYAFKVACVAASAFLIVNGSPWWAGLFFLVGVVYENRFKKESE